MNNINTNLHTSILTANNTGAEGNLLDLLGQGLGSTNNANQGDLFSTLMAQAQGVTGDESLSENQKVNILQEQLDVPVDLAVKLVDASMSASMQTSNTEVVSSEALKGLDFSLNEKEAQVVLKEVQKLVSKESILTDKETLKAIEKNPKLKGIIQKLAVENAHNLKQNKEFASLSKDMMSVLDNKPTTMANLGQKVAKKNEIAQKLGLNSNDIVDTHNKANQKDNAVTKQNMALFSKNKVQKNIIKNTSKVAAPEVSSISDSPAPKMTISDILLGQNTESVAADLAPQKMVTNIKASVASTFDMSGINAQDISSEDAMISKIKDYIIQTKASNTPTVEMSFIDRELGRVDLFVQKTNNDAMNIAISTHANEGTQFFTKNQGELLSTLASSGVQVADLKLESSNNEFNKNFDSEQRSFNKDSSQSQSKQNQQDKESQRRKELWEMFDKEIA
ncbi:MAG: hypothetical protein N4A33_07140 [Bacteriovoracaceae bacterium]|jgi:hypothetical protein|nr:hypothetical protein [Bacteriovoracaceae bacterium]